MIFTRKVPILGVGLAALMAGTATPALAQAQAGPTVSAPASTAGSNNEDENIIVVTARQRGETLLSVPVAVTAVSGETLARYGTSDLLELSKQAPTLSLDRSGSGSGGTIAIRGIGTSSAQAGFDQAVAIVVDGVQIGRPRILNQGLFDVGQVEVLAGPQSLFFGKNSPAGVISIKSAGPTNSLEGYVRGSYEFVADEALIEGALSGPLTDSLGGRVALRYRNMQGWLRNTAGPLTVANDPFAAIEGPPVLGGRRAGEEEVIGRLTLAYEPAGSNFDATLKFSGSNIDTDGPSAGFQLFSCGAFDVGVTLGVPDPYGECNRDNKFQRSGFPDGVTDNWPLGQQQPYQNTQLYLGSLTANYSFADLKLTSVSGYFNATNRYIDNYDQSSLMQIAASEREKYVALSQELRLLSEFDGPVNFLIGAYFQDTKLRFLNSSKIAALGPDPATGKFESWNKPSGTDGRTYSAFGQLIWNPIKEVEVSGGIRYTRETKDSFLAHTYAHPVLVGIGLLAPEGTVLTDDYEDSNYSPELTVSWRPTSDITAYMSYKTGYKSGGFGLSGTLIPATITADAFRFGSERVKGFEGGVKAQLFDRRMTITSAVYSYKYSDLQVNSFNPETVSFTITNAAAARVKGAELAASFTPVRPLTVYGSVAYNDASYIDFIAGCYGGQTIALGCDVPIAPGADGVSGTADDVLGFDRSGLPLARAPKWALNTGFNLDLPVSNDWQLGLSGNAKYSSKFLISDAGNIGGIQPSYWLLDASVRLSPPGERFELALVGLNLTNEYVFYSVQEKGGAVTTPGIPTQVSGVPNRGRQVSLQATFRY